MGIRLGKELHAAGAVQFLQLLKYLWSVNFKLFNTHARERESHLEGLSALPDHLQQRIQSRHIALLGDFSYSTFVFKAVIIIMVGTDVKEAVTFQVDYLVYLEI